MIEAELKFVVTDADGLRDCLDQYGPQRDLRYQDQYFTHDVLQFKKQDAEFRLRAITEAHRLQRTVMTYKGGIIDEATQSKSEYEAEIRDQREMRILLESMGFRCYIEFTKVCQDYRFSVEGHDIGATIVSLEEVDGTWIEIESIVDESALRAELEWLEHFSTTLGLAADDRTTARYEDAVASARGTSIEALLESA
jgi:adenylate cyclase class 2